MSDDELPFAPRPATTALTFAWLVFWLLMALVAVQDHARQGLAEWWKPLFWEATSCLVATLLLGWQWRRATRLDVLLHRPWRWFGAALVPLPLVAPLFVAAVFGLRHAVYAAFGAVYGHDAWGQVFLFESLKFAIFYLLFAAAVFGLRSNAALAAERLRSEQARGLQQHAQLLQLTQQLEPHFLFNALNTIASTVHADPDRADALITRLAALLRAATDLARRPHSSLGEELQLLESYGAIMQERFGARLELRFEVDPALHGCRVPTLVLQPLLENAFRHGLERCTGPACLRVQAERRGATLVLTVQDDVGRLPATPRFGIGLSNLQQRLVTEFGDRAALWLQGLPDRGVRATVELPCEC